MKILKAIAASVGITACFFYLGCGSAVVVPLGVPSISAVLPQTITAGTSAVTMKVVGTNFTQDAVILWNGNKLTTSVIDATTVSGSIQGGSLAVPGTAQLQVQDSQTGQASQAVPVSIVSSNETAALPLAISTTSLSSGIVGTSYSANLGANGGTSPYKWSITSGSLPAGLSLAAGSGMISGTPTTSGTFTFKIAVSDSSSPVQTQSATVSIIVAPAVIAPVPLTFVSSALASGTNGVAYSQTLHASGGTPGYTWSISSGSLPTGLTLAGGSGILSGTPTTSGKFTFTVTVSDSGSPVQTKSTAMSITVTSTSLSITVSTLASGTDGTAYSQTLHASGGTPNYTWSITSGSLPTGLTLAGSSGMISGTPTASGTFSFTATVSDSSSPVQTKSVGMTMTVAASQLVISTSSLPSGAEGAAYMQTLHATGGTPNYSWSITSGTLPVGVALAAGTGILSGTPTTSGKFTFTVTVSDSGSPVQTKSTAMSITVTSTSLSITVSTLASGTDGTAYSQTLHASGGTPNYTWSITSGSLPVGLSLGAGNGVITGTPTASGTFNLTVTVSDSSSTAQTKSAPFTITVAAAPVAAGPGTTWYVRPDGGTRYSTNVPTGQCNGKADAPYPGSGVNQACAFNDVRMLYQDGTYTDGTTFPAWGWVIAGGDTVIIRGSIGSGVSYRIGPRVNFNGGSYCDANNYNCWGITGDAPGSGMPPPPSGTSTQHTRILGENYGSCTSQSARTQLHGGWGTSNVIRLTGSSYVDIACLDVTDFSNCGKDADAVSCESAGNVVSDFADDGIGIYSTSTYITMTDIRIHGLASDGIAGAPGTGFVANDLDILGNADAGWNADPGDGTTGVGTLNVTNFNISWNGCVEEYPIVDPLPYFSCRDDNTGGYGDGFGTTTVASPSPGWQVHFDQGIVSYNTQDGLDALHIGGVGSTMTDTRVLAYGNEGQQLKVGGATATIQNSAIIGNCEALTETIPGRPVPTDDNISDICRAGNTAVLISTTPGDPATFQDNTIYEAGAIGLEVEYATSDIGKTNTLKYNNNVFVGFYNAGIGENSTTIYSNTNLNMLTNPGASWTNNVTFGQRSNWTCPAAGESASICTDPGLTDETYHSYGYGNMSPTSPASAVVGAGVTISGITMDYTGQNRGDPPTIGAYEQYEPLP